MKKDLIWQAALVVLGGLTTAYAGYWAANQPNQPGIINYAISSDEGLKRIFGSSSDLRLSHKGTPLNDISRASVWVSNASNKSADGVRIYLEVKDKDRPAIVADYDVPEGSPRDIVKPLDSAKGIYPFEIKYMNPGKDMLGGYRFSLFFAGPKPPEIEVTMAAKDLALRKKDSPFSIDETTILVMTLKRTWWLFVLYLILGIIYYRCERAERSIRQSKTKAILEEVTSSPIPQGTSRDQYIAEIRDEILKSPSKAEIVKAALQPFR